MGITVIGRSRIRFVLNLEEGVVEFVELPDRLSSQLFLDGQKRAVVESMDRLALDRFLEIDVVGGFERTVFPVAVCIGRGKPRDLDDDAVCVRFADEIFEPGKVLWIPMLEIEAVPAVHIASPEAASPGDDQPPASRCERILLDAKARGPLHVNSRKDSGVVETIGCQCLQIEVVVKIKIEDRPAVFPRRDRDDRLAPILEIAVVMRMGSKHLRLVGLLSFFGELNDTAH